MSTVADQYHEKATERWQELKRFARSELRSRHRAAIAVEGWADGPWERARFLVVRDELADEWRPSGGLEWSLVDTLAQAYTQLERWQKIFAERLSIESAKRKQRVYDGEKWTPPRVTEAQAEDQAMGMVDRWNRIHLRTLRSLRDLRRYASNVTIQNAGQVNIGEKHVSIVETDMDES